MRKRLITATGYALVAWAASGCTALMVGGGSSGGARHGEDAAAVQASRDSGTTAAVRRRLGADSMLGGYDIGVTTSGSRVILRGTVGSYAARQRAADIAASVDAVVAVDNRIEVERD